MWTATATHTLDLKTLHAGLDRSIRTFGFLLVGAWLFAAFSYYLSRKTGSDWFSRSGSIMGLIGAIATFRVVNMYQRKLAIALQANLISLEGEIELALQPPRSFRIFAYLGYLTGIIGTAIWGYGDLLLHLTL
ncbi:MAG TPA: hypothetical protein VME92_17680 [Acetobacteraceae bacterium]|nr:hypothetical protein [Acetobacteraceae bacterium]